MYYHGSKTSGIKKLVPNLSIHNDEYVYLTTNKAVALIYTVNAIERFLENNHLHTIKPIHPWYSYGFNQEKIPTIEEYYKDATIETYKGKSGYLYICKEPNEYTNPTNIFCAITTKEEVEIIEEIFINDVYDELKKLEANNELIINTYEENSIKKNEFIKKMIQEDINKYSLKTNKNNSYRLFLESKFPELFIDEKSK